MRRRKYPQVQQFPANAAADELDAVIAPSSKSLNAGPRKSHTNIAKAVELARERVASKDWTGAGPMHLVGLYAWLHEELYKVAPEELRDGEKLLGALGAAKRMLISFGGDASEAVKFIAWAWKREKVSVNKGKLNGRRITWQIQFSCRSLLVDYRVAQVNGQR